MNLIAHNLTQVKMDQLSYVEYCPKIPMFIMLIDEQWNNLRSYTYSHCTQINTEIKIVQFLLLHFATHHSSF